MKIPVENGFVECLDTFGDDLTVVNAARVSFAKESTILEPRDEKLIKYLANHNHNSPFFHPQVRMRLKMPIFIAREWFRHTVGFSRNEVSRRYVDDAPECWVPTTLRARDEKLKQGSKTTPAENSDALVARVKAFTEQSLALYDDLLKEKVAPEQARIVLPQSMYTEFIETASLAAYARLCGLRMDPHAQKEIQDFASAVSQIMEARFPVSWSALVAKNNETI
jgi:thymidylate synthase (FAD)